MGWGYRSEHHHIYDYEADMFTGITTYHGMVRIYNSSSWLGRWFWIVVVITAWLLFTGQAFQLLMQYHGKPTMTQINFVVPQDGMPFPSVTVCNFNPVMKENTAEWNMSREVLEYAMMAFLQPADLNNTRDYYRVEYLAGVFEQYMHNYTLNTNKNFSFSEFYRSVGYDCNSMFLKCTFGGQTFPCCNSVYMREIMTDYGKCFQFQNLTRTIMMIQRQFLAQSVDGLELMIDIQEPQAPDFLVNDIYDSGIKFITHDNNIIPLLTVNTLAVSPGYKAYGAINLRNISLLPKTDWGMCRHDWEGMPTPVMESVRNKPYSNQECMKNCLANVFLELCACVPVRYQIAEDLAVCSPLQLINCTREKKRQEIWTTFWANTCGCDVECDRLDYDVSLSYSMIPNAQAQEFLHSKYHQNDTYMRTNYLVLNLYMKQIYYERHEQTKTLNQVSVLSQIGGSMGLYMGMSIITLAEIFIFLVKTVYGIIYGNRKAQKELAKELAENELNNSNFAYQSDIDNFDTIYDPPDWYLNTTGVNQVIGSSNSFANYAPHNPTHLEIPSRSMVRTRAGTAMRPMIFVEDTEGHKTRGYTFFGN